MIKQKKIMEEEIEAQVLLKGLWDVLNTVSLTGVSIFPSPLAKYFTKDGVLEKIWAT